MFELAHPWALLALPAPLLVYWILPPHRKKVRALRVPFFAALVEEAGLDARSGSVVLRRRFLQTIGMLLVWGLIVVALAKPERVGEPIVRVESSRDVMLAIDLSGSMDYADFPGAAGETARRLTAVQRVVDRFVAERESDRIGIIVFGNRAYLQLPFTRDLDTARSLVSLMDVGMAGPQTALGDAIGLAIRSFEESEVDERLLILLTDGNDTASKMTPINAAEIAKSKGLEIYTIGVGDPAASGEDRVDFETLEAVATRTGGQFFHAESETALAEVYRRIDELEPLEEKVESWRPRHSLVHFPAAAALVCGLLLGVLMLLTTRWIRAAGKGASS